MYWSYHRSTHWYQEIVRGEWLDYDDARRDQLYRENFRMDFNGFEKMVAIMGPRVGRQVTKFRFTFPPDHRIAIALKRLASGLSYRDLQQQVGASKALCQQICVDVFLAMKAVMYTEYIHMPTLDELQDCITVCYRLTSMPGCYGAVDGCHIPIAAPAHSGLCITTGRVFIALSCKEQLTCWVGSLIYQLAFLAGHTILVCSRTVGYTREPCTTVTSVTRYFWK